MYKSTTQKSPYCLEEAGPSKEQEAETFQGTAFVLTGILSSPPPNLKFSAYWRAVLCWGRAQHHAEVTNPGTQTSSSCSCNYLSRNMQDLKAPLPQLRTYLDFHMNTKVGTDQFGAEIFWIRSLFPEDDVEAISSNSAVSKNLTGTPWSFFPTSFQ